MKIEKLNASIIASDFYKLLTNEHVINIDASTFNHVDACSVAGLFGGVLKQSSTRPASALVFGGAVHKGLECYYLGQPAELALKYALAEAEEGNLDSMNDEKRNTAKLKDLLVAYFLNENISTDTLKPATLPDGSLAIELPFSYPLGAFNFRGNTIQVNWQGKIDMLHENFDKSISIVDHKTTSIMGAQFADDKMRSNQVLGYTFATRKILGSQHIVKEFIINAIAMRSKGWDFAKFNIPISDWMVSEWETEILVRLYDFCESIESLLTFQQLEPTRHSCVTKYGKCPYFSVCSTAPAVRANMLLDSGDFATSTWSPLKD